MLQDEENANAEASRDIINNPTVIQEGSELAERLASKDAQYFLPFEHVCYNSPDDGPCFLATKGVFSCISVFAWAPSGRAFGTHIAISQLHFAFRRATTTTTKSRDKFHLLPEITAALKWTFKKEQNPKSVRVYLVGGQAAQDIDRGLVASFPGESRKHSFAWHVIGAIQKAGLTVNQEMEESTRLLNVFPGIKFNLFFEQEQRRKGHSFSLVALDRKTGALVTHTLFEQEGNYRMSCLGERDLIEEKRCAAVYNSTTTSDHGRRSLRRVV